MDAATRCRRPGPEGAGGSGERGPTCRLHATPSPSSTSAAGRGNVLPKSLADPTVAALGPVSPTGPPPQFTQRDELLERYTGTSSPTSSGPQSGARRKAHRPCRSRARCRSSQRLAARRRPGMAPTITSPDGPSAGASDPKRCELPVDNTVRAEEDGVDRKVPVCRATTSLTRRPPVRGCPAARSKRGRQQHAGQAAVHGLTYAAEFLGEPDKVSPEMQAEAIEAQCKLKGWELVDLIVERGRSAGEGKKRPGLDRARKLIRTGTARAGGVEDRPVLAVGAGLRRDPRRASPPRRRLVSVTESFDTSNAMGRAMLQITMVFAELERARIVPRRGLAGLPGQAGRHADDEGDPRLPASRRATVAGRADGADRQTGRRDPPRDRQPQRCGGLPARLRPPEVSVSGAVFAVVADARRWPLRRRCLRPRGMAGTHRRGDARSSPRPLRRSRRVNKGRPASQRWLLTSIAMCGAPDCGLPMGAGQATPAAIYRCAGSQTVPDGPAVRAADSSRRA